MNILRLRTLFIRTFRLRFARKFKNMCGLNYEYPQAQNLVKKKVEAEICPKA